MRIIISLLILLNTLIIGAQDTLTLQEAIVLGLENNYQIRISDKQLEIDKNNNAWGAAGRYPSINLNATGRLQLDEYLENPNNPTPDASEISQSQTVRITPSVDLQWLLFNGLSVNITKARYESLERLSKGNAAVVVENTLQSIVLSYHVALVQIDALEVLEEVKNLSRDRYHYVQARKQFGNAVTFDVLQAENSYLSDSANALKQEINYRNALRNLNLVLAEPVENEYYLEDELIAEYREFLLGDLIKKLEHNNRTLRNQYINQEILKKNVRLGKSRLYPMVNLSTGINNGYTALYSDWENGARDDAYQIYANLSLSYTLSDGGNIHRDIQNARIREEMGTLRTEEMKQSLYNQLFNTLEQYNIKKQLLNVSNASVTSAKLNMQIADEKFRSGAINSFNYRDIQLIYLNSARDQLQAKYNLTESYTELLRLTGGIVTEYE